MKNEIIILLVFVIFVIFTESEAYSLYITGIWKQYGSDRYFMNKNNDHVWFEVVNGRVLNKYRSQGFVDPRNEQIVLSDLKRPFFYKLSDDRLFWSVNDNMKKKSFDSFGRWIIRPGFLSLAHRERETILNLDVSDTTYTVQFGDSLFKIASNLCKNPSLYKQIAEDNNIPNPDVIFPDQKLVINCKSRALLAPKSTRSSADKSTTTTKSNLFAKWVWKNDPNHYLLNLKNSLMWREYKNTKLLNEYDFIRSENNFPILQNKKRKLFIKVFDFAIFTVTKASKLVKEYAFGSWEMKPTFNK